MRKRVVPIITWPLRFLRRLLGLLLAPFRKLVKLVKRDKKPKPVSPQEAVSLDKPVAPAKPGETEKPGKPGKPGKRRRLKSPPNPFKKLLALRGKPRIAALVILGVAVVVVVLALRPGPNDEKDVRATLTRYATATRDKDYQALCDNLFSKRIKAGLISVSLPCEVALSTSTLKDLRNPTLTILAVEVSGDQAAAKVRSGATGEVPSVDTIKLVRENGGWRIDSLSEPGTQPAGAGVP
jgi:hypothetical protein